MAVKLKSNFTVKKKTNQALFAVVVISFVARISVSKNDSRVLPCVRMNRIGYSQAVRAKSGVHSLRFFFTQTVHYVTDRLWTVIVY